MSDIKFRLRTPANAFYEYSVDGGQLLRDAADYIATLEAQLAGGEAVGTLRVGATVLGMGNTYTSNIDGMAACALPVGEYKLYTAPAIKQQVADVDWLSNVIRRVDGNNTLGAGALAEKIVEAMQSVSANQPDSGKVPEVLHTAYAIWSNTAKAYVKDGSRIAFFGPSWRENYPEPEFEFRKVNYVLADDEGSK